MSLTKLAVWALLIAAFYAGLQYAQLYFYASAFDDFIRDEVKFAPTRESTDEDHLRTHILDASQQYGMTVEPKDIRVTKTRDPDHQLQMLDVEVTYSAPLDFSLFKRQLNFRTDATVSY